MVVGSSTEQLLIGTQTNLLAYDVESYVKFSIIVYPLYTVICRICTYVHPLYMYIHHIHTSKHLIYTSKHL